MLNIYPDNISTNVIVPLSHEKNAHNFRMFFHDVAAENQKRIKRSVAFSDEVQQERHRPLRKCSAWFALFDLRPRTLLSVKRETAFTISTCYSANSSVKSDGKPRGREL